MKKEFEVKIVRPAKASGGDRYEHGVLKDDDHMVIYIPQHISRSQGGPFPLLHITIADVLVPIA